ncbi:hypothetical protein EPUS_05584 [Endocarpon pusillum Z07020]|uniref:Heterokaryon incompatibility domain-containing protein n=1 Tax=Endocarpon pusillum (strain Z07020 / HMAS-L-300199) TaxID=1263415 RepID=U1G358_ENDPU|nr:uncharacterized protein EPUS_05584 [Endocarpon pusillum Z07020]ERF71712.1 hypothetical protein EPUS_05584 [Endocarpon pusillum Z07020]
MSCRACHSRCNRLVKRPKWYPTRLLDIGVSGDSTWALRTCSKEPPSSPNYMTLSYRWGSVPCLKLLRSNIEELSTGKPIRDLPLTFRDSIAVARRFSIRYLWIDRLCILQDSQEDWLKESSAMRDVYANSSCNIAAAVSSDPHGGLFRFRYPADIQPGVVQLKFSNLSQENFFIFDELYWDRQVSDTVLHSRGWVFQECLLAPRVLHFTEKQIFWECFNDRKCEGFPSELRFGRRLKDFEPLFGATAPRNVQDRLLSEFAYDLWIDFINAYSKCALTRSTDRLVALSGLAKLYQEATGDEYVAGMWRSRLPWFLAWYVRKPIPKSSSEYCAPSWSWASVGGPVLMPRITPSAIPLIDVFDVQITPSTGDHTGQLSGGFVVVKGCIVHSAYPGVLGPRWMKIGDDHMRLYVKEDTRNSNSEQSTQIYFLALICGPKSPDTSSILTGLVLQPLARSSDEYTRIGLFTVLDPAELKYFGVRLRGRKVMLTPEREDLLSVIKIF